MGSGQCWQVLKVLGLYFTNCFIFLLFSQSAVSTAKFVGLIQGWSMAVSALEPCTPATQQKLVLLGTFGNSFLMMPRLARASLL